MTTNDVPVPPRAVPDDNRVLTLEPDDVWWRSTSMQVRVIRSRPDISQYYDGDWLWLDVEYLDRAGAGQELVSTAAIARQQ